MSSRWPAGGPASYIYNGVIGAGVGAGTAAYTRHGSTPPTRQYNASGYAQGQPGTRAVDDYYNTASAYPPQQRQPTRQASAHTVASSQSVYNNVAAPPMPVPAANQYLSTAAPYGTHHQYPTTASQEHGYPERSTTCKSSLYLFFT